MLYFNIHWQVLVIIIYLNAFLLIKLLKTWVITHHIYWAPNVFQIFCGSCTHTILNLYLKTDLIDKEMKKVNHFFMCWYLYLVLSPS